MEAPRTGSSRHQGRSAKSTSGGRFLLFWLACLLLFLVWRNDLVLPFELPFQLSAIASRSMAPAYPMGSLVAVVPADKIEVGDVIVFRVPLSARETYGLPPSLLHRVVEYDVAGGRLKTKGDALEEPDPFTVDVVWVLGKPRYNVPYLGFVLLFLWSDFGKPWLAFVAFAAVYPALAGHFQRMAERVNRLLALGGTGPVPAVAGPVVQRPPASPPETSPASPDRLDSVYHEVRATRTSLQHWEAAMGEYATHLKTHTAILLHLNEATDRLAAATTEFVAETRRSGATTGAPLRSAGQEAPPWPAGQTADATDVTELLRIHEREALPPAPGIVMNPADFEFQPDSEPMLGKWFSAAGDGAWHLEGVI
ncbi:MAG: hypothetical protein Q8P31_03355 [Bacillota bacterium]|nr:hypothetical protein [Bacillota bacterium]